MNIELAKLEKEHPELFAEAYETVKQGRVKKYLFKPGERVRWVVVGRTRDYLVVPAAGFCTCEDFFFRVMSHEKPMCYHLLAVKIAELTEKYTVIEESVSWHDRLMEEWVFYGKA
ncbi:MAG: SWIM zinc finger family protein [Candidatus Caldarchaeum sp.]|nr:SWIM zinc finger family protein [Candidatus Caldarchaeum sp.]